MAKDNHHKNTKNSTMAEINKRIKVLHWPSQSPGGTKCCDGTLRELCIKNTPNVVKKSGPKFLLNDVRYWYCHIENDSFNLLRLKVTLQAIES